MNPATTSGTVTLIYVSVSDEIDHFLAHNISVGQQPGETRGEVSEDLKDLAAEFSTNERTNLSTDDDLLKIIERLLNKKLPKVKIDGLTEKFKTRKFF